MKLHPFSRKHKLIHFNRNSKKFNTKRVINLKEMRLIFKIDIRILKL